MRLDKIKALYISLGKWKWIGLSLILILSVIFREYLVQFILLLLAFVCIGYVLYKIFRYIFKFSLGTIKLTLKFIAGAIAIFVIVALLSKIQI